MKTDEMQGKYDVEKLKLEHAALQKYAAIQKALEDKIGVQKIYIDITQDIEAAFILDELIYFSLPRGAGRSALRVWKDGVLWMAVQRSEWWERKRLTPRQADAAISKLESQGLVIKEVFKFNSAPTTHLRLNIKTFFEMYSAELEKGNPPEDHSDSLTKDLDDLYEMMGIPKSPNGNFQNGETDLPNGETESPNGDFLNNPHQPSHIPPFDEDLSDIGWSIAKGQKVTKKQLYKQSTMKAFEDMLESQFKRFPLNWIAFDEKAKEAFRRFVTALPEGQSLEKFVDWWMLDERRVSSPPFTLAIIMQRWPQAFVKVKQAEEYQTLS